MSPDWQLVLAVDRVANALDSISWAIIVATSVYVVVRLMLSRK